MNHYIKTDQQQLARVPVQHSRDLEPLPEHTDFGDVGVPDMVGVIGLKEMISMVRRLCRSKPAAPSRLDKLIRRTEALLIWMPALTSCYAMDRVPKSYSGKSLWVS